MYKFKYNTHNTSRMYGYACEFVCAFVGFMATDVQILNENVDALNAYTYIISTEFLFAGSF